MSSRTERELPTCSDGDAFVIQDNDTVFFARDGEEGSFSFPFSSVTSLCFDCPLGGRAEGTSKITSSSSSATVSECTSPSVPGTREASVLNGNGGDWMAVGERARRAAEGVATPTLRRPRDGTSVLWEQGGHE